MGIDERTVILFLKCLILQYSNTPVPQVDRR